MDLVADVLNFVAATLAIGEFLSRPKVRRFFVGWFTESH